MLGNHSDELRAGMYRVVMPVLCSWLSQQPYDSAYTNMIWLCWQSAPDKLPMDRHLTYHLWPTQFQSRRKWFPTLRNVCHLFNLHVESLQEITGTWRDHSHPSILIYKALKEYVYASQWHLMAKSDLTEAVAGIACIKAFYNVGAAGYRHAEEVEV